MKNKFKYKNFFSNGGFTLIEIIAVFSIMSILISITYPSLKRYFLHQERDSYFVKLISFIEQIKRETRRYGISCDLKTIRIRKFKAKNQNKPFELNCYGSEETINNLRFEVPKITKNIFQQVSGDLTFTPKGQVFVNEKRILGFSFGNSYVVIVGLKEQTNGFNESIRCLFINPPTGVITHGIYKNLNYQTRNNYKVSDYNGTLASLQEKNCLN